MSRTKGPLELIELPPPDPEDNMTRIPHAHPSRRVSAPLVALVLALAACGDDNSSPPPAPPEPTQSTLVPTGNTGFVEARTSQIVTNGAPPSQVFDDFTFATDGTIRSVRWQGIYCVQQANAPAPAPTASSFTVSFYTDAAGRPNIAAPVQTSTYTVAQTGQAFEKNVGGLNCGTAANTTWPFYNYAVTLATPFTASAGTKYWISVQATTPSYDVYFGWRDGTVNNRMSLQLFEGDYTTYDVDRAYALEP
jgi:hypothetical protein